MCTFLQFLLLNLILISEQPPRQQPVWFQKWTFNRDALLSVVEALRLARVDYKIFNTYLAGSVRCF